MLDHNIFFTISNLRPGPEQVCYYYIVVEDEKWPILSKNGAKYWLNDQSYIYSMTKTINISHLNLIKYLAPRASHSVR